MKAFSYVRDVEAVIRKKRDLHVKYICDEQGRAAIARELGLQALDVLTLTGEVTRWRKIGVRFLGQLTAQATQSCVASLAPVEAQVHEEVDICFLPQEELDKMDVATELVLDEMTPEELPDPLQDEGIDFGHIAYEYLSVNLDPYPRAQGSDVETGILGAGIRVMSEEVAEAESLEKSPFSALKAIKKSGK